MGTLKVNKIQPTTSSTLELGGISSGSFTGSFSGDGSQLTNLPVPPIPTNLATTGSNSFVGNQTISGSVTATSFSGDGSGLTNLPGGGGGGLEGSQYLFVAADGTDIENAAELQAAYDQAKTMSPSATNRITVIAAPGNYNFDSSIFEMDTQYIDLVSLDGNCSIIFNGSETINITANDVFVKGVNTLNLSLSIGGDNLNLLKVENCKGGNFSFGWGGNISGTFVDCEGGDYSFASAPFSASPPGVLYNGDISFASGTFINCKAGFASFGLDQFGFSVANGLFLNCQSGNNSFGGNQGTASGTFTNCIGGADSFGGSGTLSGKLYYCRLTSGTFETVSGNGVTVLCIDGNNAINTQN